MVSDREHEREKRKKKEEWTRVIRRRKIRFGHLIFKK